MKRLSSVLVASALVATLGAVGLGEREAKADDYPNKAISLIVAFGAGGGTDVGARVLVPFLEKELGATVNVINKPGAAGWVGWTDLIKARPDGYTIGFINSPNIVSGYLDPQFKRPNGLDSLDLLANQVLDTGAFAINPKDKRFTSAKELVEYAKANEVTCAQDGVGSDDWIALTLFNKKYGTKFTSVATKSTAESLAALMGEHVDVVFANIGELKVPHDNKDIKVVAVMSKKRSKFLPDIPDTKELGYEVYSASSRSVAAPKGLPPEIKTKLVSALEKAINDPKHVEKMKTLGLEVVFMKGTELKDYLKGDEENVSSVKWW